MNEVVLEQNVPVVDVSCVEEVEARLLKEGVVCQARHYGRGKLAADACSLHLLKVSVARLENA